MKRLLDFTLLSITILVCSFLSVKSTAQMNWEKDPNNPIFTGIPGNWNYSVYSPVVLFDESTFKMWFLAYFDGDYNVGYAESDNGTDWETINFGFPVIYSGQPGEWDRYKSPRTIIRVNDTLKMWYHGTPNFIDIFSIGYAWSLNGLEWDFHPEPVLGKGDPGSWDDSWVYAPSVCYDGTAYHMWYSGSGNFDNDEVGYAFSEDGINWIKEEIYNPVIQLGDPGTFYDEWIQAGPVLFHDGIYHMWLGGFDGSKFEIGYATSADKINWTIQNNMQPVVYVGPPGSWDDYGIHQPSVIIHHDTLKMWYGGRGALWQIGYAIGDNIITYSRNITADMEVNLEICPNPVSQFTKISFHLPVKSYTELSLFNTDGKKIMVLIREKLIAGKHEFELYISDLNPGIYFCTLKTNNGMQTKKIIKL